MKSNSFVVLSCCPTTMIPQGTLNIQDYKNRLLPIESGIISLSFWMASTMTDEGVRMWKDPYELIKYLLDFENIVTFNGELFDMPLIVSDVIKSIDPTIIDPQKIIDQDDFYNLYSELYSKSYDLFKITKHATGGCYSLANLAESTLKITRNHTLTTAMASKDLNDILGVVNYVLENVTLTYNLRYVGQQLKKLAFKGPDDRIINFDV